MLKRRITQEEKDQYQKDGVVCLRGLFDMKVVDKLRVGAEQCMAAPPSDLTMEIADMKKAEGRFFFDTFLWLRNDICRNFVHESDAAEIAASVMQSRKVNIFFDQWLIKEPGTQLETPWHHDLPYWPVLGDHVCTLWLALDPVTADSGAVEYVRGSHRWGQRLKPASFSGATKFSEELPKVPDIEAERDKHDIVSFDLEPGDCTIHHGLLVHHAPGNARTDRRRRAYVTRWAGDNAVFHPHDGIQHMPPLPDIPAGGPLDSELWPVIWREDAGRSA
ncbi:MAG: phytanoyl-CoA dioxygenase family protein [Minwuiales bacterium]|nr:phytanoyl-CoA dioxygenase family protein [Minwuiales bacterium]